MPTILSHPAVPLAISVGLGQTVIPSRLLIAGVIASIIPDFDVLAFKLGIPYASMFGHRGFSHSLAFAFMLACLLVLVARSLRASWLKSFLFVFFAASSHAVLDAFTNGGLGVALLSPWSSERYFAPVQVIQVSPIGARFFSQRGLDVLYSELFWVWLPCAVFAVLLFVLRRLFFQKDE